jgi:hypothetical protein
MLLGTNQIPLSVAKEIAVLFAHLAAIRQFVARATTVK